MAKKLQISIDLDKVELADLGTVLVDMSDYFEYDVDDLPIDTAPHAIRYGKDKAYFTTEDGERVGYWRVVEV